MSSTISLVDNHFEINGYSIYGSYEEGYLVYLKGRDSWEILYRHISLENCIVWCLNS